METSICELSRTTNFNKFIPNIKTDSDPYPNIPILAGKTVEMLHLLLLEWKKLSLNRTFVVMSSLYLALLPATYLIGKFIIPDSNHRKGSFNEIELQTFLQDPYMFPFVWKSFGYTGSWFNFYALGIIGILIITMEYNHKTMRQSIINGLTRTEFFLSKTLMILAVSLFFSLYFLVCGLVIGFINTDTVYTAKIFQHIDIVPLYSLQIMGYMSLAAFFGWVFKRFSLAIIIYFAYPLFELILKWVLLAWMGLKHILVLCLPVNAMEDLIPIYFPVSGANVEVIEQTFKYEEEMGIPFFLSATQSSIVTICFIALFLFLSYRIFMRSDL